MVSPALYAAGAFLLMLGLLIEACIFRALHDDPPSAYKLSALRDKLIRLVIDGKIRRDEPHFDALYRNVSILLRGSRLRYWCLYSTSFAMRSSIRHATASGASS